MFVLRGVWTLGLGGRGVWGVGGNKLQRKILEKKIPQ